jgi:serine/threonine-protein kinase
MQVTLTVTAGPHKGRVFTFAGHDTFFVGRSKYTHFRLSTKDRYFSRVHFMVEVNPPQCRLVDMDSRNGTQVNGVRVRVADLRAGDRIRAGRTILRVSIEDSEQTWDGPVAELVPPVPTTHVPPVTAVAPATDSCRVCATPLVAGPTPARSSTDADFFLCPVCREQARSRSQPIPGYLLVRELGRGGMGVVYVALRRSDGTVVALKTILPAMVPTEADIARFRREASILYELDHPNIVAFRDMGEADGLLYFAMDYVRGTDARRLLEDHGPLAIGRAVGLVSQVLQALEYAHAKGFVHRDIKPSNLLVTGADEGERAVLADFGLARVYQESKLSGLTMLGDRGGTVPYMAPEQITNFRAVQPPADQYSTGATLYTLLTDRWVYDFPAPLQQQLLMILDGEPVPIQSRRPEVPAELAAVIHRALAKEPEGRFPDAKAMHKALLPFGH